MNPVLEKSTALVKKKYHEFFLPTVLGALAGQMGLFVDSLIVGNLISSDAMTGVSVCLPLTQTLAAVSILLSTGSAGMIAVASGARKKEDADRIFRVVMILNVAVSLLIACFVLAFLSPLSSFLAGEEVIAAQTYGYLKIIVFGIPFNMLLLSLSTLIRSDGMASLSSQGIIISQCVNLGVDLLLIGVFKMNISGAAIATVSGDLAGTLWIMVRYFRNPDRTLHFTKHEGGEKGFLSVTKELLSLGFPIAAGMWLVSVKIWCIYRILGNSGGADAMKIYSVCMYVLTLLSLVAEGCNGALLPILGVLYGEKDYKGVRMLVRYDLKFILSVAGVLVVVLLIAPQAALKLYNLPPELVESGAGAVRLFSISLLGVAATFQMMLYYSTVGQDKAGNILAFVEGFAAVVPVAFILVKLIGLNGVWFSFIFAEIAGFAVLYAYVRWVGKHSEEGYTDLFLIPLTDPELIYDVSLKATKENAAVLSKDAIDALKNAGVSDEMANKAGVALEEMTVNIAGRKEGKPSDLDVRITGSGDDMVLSLRDNGSPFNPVEYAPDEKDEYRTDGIFVLKAVAKDVKYSRVLALNQTTIEI